MSHAASHAVWTKSKADRSTLLVLLALADWADDDGYSFPSLTTLARKARLSRQGTIDAVRELIALGELDRMPHGHAPREGATVRQRTNEYRITLVKLLDQSKELTSPAQPATSQVSPVQLVKSDPAHIRKNRQDTSEKPSQGAAGGLDAVAQVITRWRDGWKLIYGHDNSLIETAVEIVDLGLQIERLGLPAVLEAVDAYLATEDRYAHQVQHSLRVFAKDPNRWRAKEKVLIPRSGNERRQQTRDANAAHVADGRLADQLKQDFPEQFK